MGTKELAKQLGISHQMANRYKAKGMPTDSLEAAIAWRKSNVDPFRSKSGRIGGNSGVKHGKGTVTATQEENRAIEDLKKDISDCQLDLASTDADELYRNARALKEKALALQAAAEHEKFMGELVLRNEVEKVVFERSRQFRDGLLTCSRRIAPDIADMSDVKQIEDIMYKEFRLLLEAFARLPVIE